MRNFKLFNIVYSQIRNDITLVLNLHISAYCVLLNVSGHFLWKLFKCESLDNENYIYSFLFMPNFSRMRKL